MGAREIIGFSKVSYIFMAVNSIISNP